MKKSNISLWLFILYFFFLPLKQINAQNKETNKKFIMVSVRKENSNDWKLFRRIYNEAFKRIGKGYVIKYYPAKRGGILANRGEVDGELARIYNYNESFPNLIRVEEPIFTIKISAFATDPRIRINRWSDFIGTDYIVEYMFGLKAGYDNLSRVMDKGKLFHVYHWSTGLKNLAAGRSDIYIGVERTVLAALKTETYKSLKIINAGVIEKQTIHAFFHKKHKAIVPLLSSALTEMRSEGLLEKFNTESLNNFR